MSRASTGTVAPSSAAIKLRGQRWSWWRTQIGRQVVEAELSCPTLALRADLAPLGGKRATAFGK